MAYYRRYKQCSLLFGIIWIYHKSSYIDINWQQVMRTESGRGSFEKQKYGSKNFFAMLQRGDLCMQGTIQNAVMLLGYTKSGKTTLAHYLAGNSLIGRNFQGSCIYQLFSRRNIQAVIGNDCKSETLIPNILKDVVKQSGNPVQISIIDMPGYCDTTGSENILLSNYFRYQSFSKIKNIKFVIVLDGSSLLGTCRAAIQVISQFISGFKDYAQIQRQIIDATSIVINKYVTKRPFQKQFRALIDSLRIQYSHRREIQELIYTVQWQARLFFVQQSVPNSIVQNKTLLQSICSKSRYWSRKIDDTTKQADMSDIQSNLGREMFHFGQKGSFRKKLVHHFNKILASIRQRTHILFNFDHNRANLGYILESILINAFSLIGQEESNYKAAIQAFQKSLSRQLSGKQFYEVIKQLNIRLDDNQEQSKEEPQIYTRMRVQFKRVIAYQYARTFNQNDHQSSSIVMLQIIQIAKKILRLISDIQSNKIQRISEIAQCLFQIFVGLRKIRFLNSNQEYRQYCKIIQTFYYSLHRILLEGRVIKEILKFNAESKQEQYFLNQTLSNFRFIETIRQSLCLMSQQVYQGIKIVDYLRQKLQIQNI